MKMFAVLFPLCAVVACAGKDTHMEKPDVIALISQLASKDLSLSRVQCVDKVHQGKEDTLCYAAPYDAEEFMRRVDDLDDFRSLTGWRDDYGVASANLQYQKVPRRISFIYGRPSSFWDRPRYGELRANKAQGYVVLVVNDEDPAERP